MYAQEWKLSMDNSRWNLEEWKGPGLSHHRWLQTCVLDSRYMSKPDIMSTCRNLHHTTDYKFMCVEAKQIVSIFKPSIIYI